jgi:hypothetical protein
MSQSDHFLFELDQTFQFDMIYEKWFFILIFSLNKWTTQK